MRVARRNFLRGLPPAAPPPIRPPGASGEDTFVVDCTACGDCIDACPQHIIVPGSGGLPEVDFVRGECTFCDECSMACGEEALQAGAPPRRITLRVLDRCLAHRQVICQSCADVCDEQAIRFPPVLGAVASPEIHEEQCTGCGACVAACPETALEALANG